MKSLDIGEIARRSGTTPATLRYYETLGLIAPDGRKGLRRQYDAAVLDRLALIAMGRMAGFSLDEIGQFLGRGAGFEIDRARLHDRADAVDRRIRELRVLSRALRHVAECPAPQHSRCPTFRRMMDQALNRAKSR
ncbi:helix-turn-helix domain-containing protein [Pukyongiella litopenaei]|uniref:Helix-turn-helix domain-containing protein n=1 Tax=Pukyongiella litopenaei TaxID=2605946 RepID=A0A2S0MLK0_9RHOB|nr:helix-turn-helix domain-containing protein [Pukyongiella litopenaei]AVO36754.1 helix-turn-helix domain-containing protein [Pukyongiella litopenaei]